MTATAFLAANESGLIVSSHSTERAAASIAERTGGTVVIREITAGERVSFTWHGWPKTGTVVSGTGSKVTVSFPLASGSTTKTIAVDKLTFGRKR